MTKKTAKDAMTPIASAFCLDANAKLDMSTMQLIMSKGHSRVPVYSGSPANIIGLILVKSLLTTHPEEEIPVRQHATIRRIPRVEENMPLYAILNEFRMGHSHMAAVVKNKVKVDATHRSKEQVEGRLSSSRFKRRSSAEIRVLQGTGTSMSFVLDIAEDQCLTDSGHYILLKRSPLSGSGFSILPKDNDVNVENPSQRAKKWERSSQVDMLDLKKESLCDFPPEEEVIGIITMEDVIEELLQEEILDETDGYIDIHNKIKVNMLPMGGVSPNSSFFLSSSSSKPTNGKDSPLSLVRPTPTRMASSPALSFPATPPPSTSA